MNILCTSDFQLGVHGRLDDQADVLDRIAQTAIDREVGLVLNAGDTFEGPGVPPECLDVFARFVARLRDKKIDVLTTLGNGRHDAAVRGVNGLAIFDHVPGVAVAPLPDVYRFDGVVVGTLPWVHPGKLIARKGGGNRDEINAEISALLIDIAERLASDCQDVDPDAAHVLLGHWHVDQATSANGSTATLFGEPLLPLYELERLGFDAIALGHNHRGQILTAEPPIFHAGSPMPHDFGEAGFEHGVWILDAIQGAATVEFVPIESRPLVTYDLDLTAGDDDFPHGYDFAAPTDAIVRLRVRATAEKMRAFDLTARLRELLELGAHTVKIVPDIVRADRARVEGVDENLTTLDALGLYIEANAIEPELAEAMRDHTTRYLDAVTS